MSICPKIVYVNQKFLADQRLKSVLDIWPQHGWANMVQRVNFDPPTSSLYVRSGENTLPLNNDVIGLLGAGMPEYDPNFNLDFSDIMDSRCIKLRKSHWDRPWLIHWSGGIDSTSIIVSLLKNLPIDDLSNIKIVCNSISVYENPRFFLQHIQPNFAILDGSLIDLDESRLLSYYYINGEPADQLFAGGVAQSMLLENPTNGDKSLDYDGELIQYISRIVGSRCAEWYVDVIKKNIASVEIPINTYHDFFWWNFFNFSWVASAKLRSINSHPSKNCRIYMENFVHWFDYEDFQRWAMVNNYHGIKYGSHPGEYKSAIKKYIQNYDRNDYYYIFKTKTFSDSRSTQELPYPWFCMLDDFTRLSIDQDLDLIIQLLPDHINQNLKL